MSDDDRAVNGTRVSARRLMEEAERARGQAHAPYSKFAVGAALLTRGGRVVHGSNVENASYGLSVCAERTALWKAVTEGEREFSAIAVTAGPGAGAAPCGACRQVLQEFAPALRVFWRDARGRIMSRMLEELLSEPFRPESLLAARPKSAAVRDARRGSAGRRASDRGAQPERTGHGRRRRKRSR